MHARKLRLLTAAALAATAAPLHASDRLGAPLDEDSFASAGPRSLAGALLFDEPGDGTLWALGGTRYKARFGPDGTTSYHPALGADAPRSEPLHIGLRAAWSGDTPLTLAPAVPLRAGSTVSYDRGALVELYELRQDSMEQKFVVERLVGEGDLVLHVELGTALGCLQTAAGLRFESERGGVSYSRAIAFDARGVEGPVTMSWHAGRVEIRVAAEFLATAALPLVIDPVIETFGVTSDNLQHFTHSDVAYDSVTERFAVVWAQRFSQTDVDVLQVLYDSDGVEVPGSLVAVDITDDRWSLPQVASNRAAAQFLTVAEALPAGGGTTRIEGRTRQAASNLQAAQFQISGVGGSLHTNPDVGGNPEDLANTYYCVVWQVASKGVDDIEYQLVRADGSHLFGAPQALAVGPWEDRNPSISKSCGRSPIGSQQWSVVWQRGNFSGEYDVAGACLQWSGAITTPAFWITNTGFDDRFPQASSPLDGGGTSRPYMVTWQREGGLDPDVWGTVLSGSDVLVPQVNLSLVEGGDFVAQDQSRPVVDSDGLSFTVAYREHYFGDPANRKVHASTFRMAGGALLPVEVHDLCAVSFDDQDRPAISAMNGPTGWQPATPGRALITWEEERPLQGTWAIEGALYECVSGTAPGAALCFGDGSAAACPCGNESASPAGCVNSTGSGARLSARGSNRIALDDLELSVDHAVPGQPGLFFQGNVVVGAGGGVAFGDGVRCCGQGVVRLQVAVASPAGIASTSDPLAAEGGVEPGDTRCYQYWYRDPAGGGVCGTSFNLSNAYEVLWAP